MLIDRAETDGDGQKARLVKLWTEMRAVNAQLLDAMEQMERDGLQMPPGAPGGARPAAGLNIEALAGAITAVEELLAARGSSVPPEKKAKLVGLVYRQLTKDGAEGEIERGYIDTLIDLAS